MTQSFSETDPFPASEFDQWAGQYDEDVTREGFPFTGYQRVLAETARLAGASAGMTVLDLGTGTGKLAELLAPLGCALWCSDFSGEMLALARPKLPGAHFFLHDLRKPFPAGLPRFDRIVSAYVFHHFELPEKIAIIRRLLRDQLAPGGRLVIADLSFPTRQARDAARQAAGADWDEEPYWIAAEALPALEANHIGAGYVQVSDCAGIYQLSNSRG